MTRIGPLAEEAMPSPHQAPCPDCGTAVRALPYDRLASDAECVCCPSCGLAPTGRLWPLPSLRGAAGPDGAIVVRCACPECEPHRPPS
jgi:hypothetical protein